MSASWSPPSEDLSAVPPSSDLTTDSSNNTEVSSSSRSRLESAFHAITLVWGWGTTVDTVSCDCTGSGLESDLGARSFMSRNLVRDRVIIGVWLGTDLGLLGTGVGTDLTGNRRFLFTVFTLPWPSRRRTLNTGIEALGCAVTTYTSSCHLSANCLPCNPICRNSTWSPGCRAAPRTFLAYHFWLASPFPFSRACTTSWACLNLSRSAAMKPLKVFSPVTAGLGSSKSIGSLGSRPNNRKYGEKPVEPGPD